MLVLLTSSRQVADKSKTSNRQTTDNLPKSKTSQGCPDGNHFWRPSEGCFRGGSPERILGISKGLFLDKIGREWGVGSVVVGFGVFWDAPIFRPEVLKPFKISTWGPLG